MSLRVWLPLTKDLRNQGLDDVIVTNNGATFNSEGKLGGSYTGRIDISSSVIPTILNGSEFTVAFWIYINEVPTGSGVADTYVMACGTSGTRTQFHIAIRQNGAGFAFCFYADDYTFYNTVTDKVGKWMHVVCAFKNNTQIVYVDGTKVGERATAGGLNIAANSILYIYAAHERLNDVRIYDHCLSPMEVKELSQGLVLHYPLNRGGFGQENLFKNSSLTDLTSANLSTKIYYQGSYIPEITQDGLKFTWTDSGAREIDLWLNKTLKVDTYYTLSFVYRNNMEIGSSFYLRKDGHLVGYWSQPTIPYSENWAKYSCTFKIANYQTNDATTGTLLTLFYSGYTANKWIELKQNSIKLEEGSLVTPWCPANTDELTTIIGLNSTTEYDCSGFCNNGEIHDTTITYSSDTPKYNISTKNNQANNSSNYPLKGNLILNDIDKITIAMWGKPVTNGHQDSGFISTSAVSSPVDYQQTVLNHYDSKFACCNTSGTVVTLSVSGQFTLNEWHHYAFVYDGSKIYFYKDGVLKTSANQSGKLKPITCIFPFYSRAGGADRTTSGNMSDLRVYTTALSANDVKSLYQNSAYIDSSGNVYGAVHTEV